MIYNIILAFCRGETGRQAGTGAVMKQMLGKQDDDPNAGLGRQIANSKTTLKFKSLKDIKILNNGRAESRNSITSNLGGIMEHGSTQPRGMT